MSFLLAANWKMHKTPKETEVFFEELNKVEKVQDVELAFFVSSVNAESTANSLKGSPILWGPQNIFFEDQGAFTGETSPQVMAELGAKRCLVGHSERRQLFHESFADTQKKLQACWRHGLRPMLCVGENLKERQEGRTLQVIEDQLKGALGEGPLFQDIDIAYEPVWAIGTGEVASPEQVAEVHSFLHEFLKSHYSESAANSLLYGGSVKAANSAELSQVPHVHGFLVGGASLKVESFLDIARQLQL